MTLCLLLDMAEGHWTQSLMLVSKKSATTSDIPIPIAGPELINPMERLIHSDQKEAVKLQLTSPSTEIIGEGAAIFTDMTNDIGCS